MTGAPYEAEGLISVRSTVSLAETIEGLLVAVQRRGMVIYASIDHAKEAERVGVKLRPTHLLIAGYTDVEAPVIAKCQLLGMDLPHKIMVWEDEEGAAWVAYNDPRWFGRRHHAGSDACSLLEAIGTSLAGIAREATGTTRDPRDFTPGASTLMPSS